MNPDNQTATEIGSLISRRERENRRQSVGVSCSHYGFANLYYEICNEPYFGGVTLEWQRHVADTITEAEASLGEHHLVSPNIAKTGSSLERLSFTHTGGPRTLLAPAFEDDIALTLHRK